MISAKLQWDWCHIVSVVAVLRAGQSRVQIWTGTRHFSVLQNAQTFYGAHKLDDLCHQPPIHTVPGFFLAIRRMGHEVNHSSAPSIEVKNEWNYTSSPPICLHGTERDSFTFTSVACGEKYKSLCNFLQFFFMSFSHLNILLSSDSDRRAVLKS